MTAATPGTPFERLMLHPVYIARVAGEPADLLTGLGTGDTARHLARLASLAEELDVLGQSLVAAIEARVPQLKGKQTRAALNAKRAIFNRAAVKAADVALLGDALAPGTAERIAQYQRDWEQCRAMEAATAATFDAELADSADALLSMLQRRNIVDGLSYTNPELLEKFRQRLPVDAPSSATGKARRSLEDALLQYAARVATKTSPLSSFTMLGVGRWQRQGNDLAMEFGTDVERRVAFKGALFRHLEAAILSRFELAARITPLEINPSVQINGDRLQLKAITPGSLGSGRFWGTGEDRVEAAHNAVMALIAHVFTDAGGVPLSADSLVERICAKAPKLAPAEVMLFLAKLYGIQYLRPARGTFEQDDAMASYVALLAPIEGELGDALRTLAARMHVAAETFHVADAAGRSEAMLQLQADIRQSCVLLGVDHDTPLFKPVLFENCYLQPQGRALAAADLEPYAADLELLLEVAVLTDLTHQTRCELADFFLSRFGQDGVCETVEAFLETFDEIYGPGKFVDAPPGRRAPRSAASKGLMLAADRFHDLLEPLLRETGETHIDAGALREVLDAVPAEIRNRSLSQSYLLQFAREGAQRMAVVNQMFGGRSALMSRFLEVLDEPAIDEVRDYVRAGSDTGYAVELPGVFGFNANHHPMLADAELAVPPFPPGRAGTERVALARASMVYDAHTHSVVLRTPQGRRFDLFYQGFLIPSLLPSMHRVLALGFGDGPSQFAIATLLTRDIVKPDVLTQVPRLRLGSLVLARRIWIIPFNQVPDIQLEPADFFVAVQAWRAQHGFPNDVFFRVIPIPGAESEGSAAEAVEWHTFKFKNLKPFYVRLDSPRFVRLMQRTLKRDSYSVSLTEALPALDDQHVSVGGRPHVSELQVEMTRPARALAPEKAITQALLADAVQKGTDAAARAAAFADWTTVRIAYFAKERSALLLGPVRQAVDAVRARFPSINLTLQTQWKFGPHLELSFNAGMQGAAVFDLVASIVNPWLQQHPSQELIDPEAYAALSAKLGMSELEPGPYLPLLEDNTISRVPYQPARALATDELVESKHLFLSEALDLQLELLALRSDDADVLSLTLIAMMAVCGDTYAPHGLSKGFMSFRSHAEYFFAAYDGQGTLRTQFDALDRAKQEAVDAILQALGDGDVEQMPLPAPHRAVVQRWIGIVGRTADRNERIVRQSHERLLAGDTFDSLVKDLATSTPAAFQQRARAKATSELGNAFDAEAGHRIQSSPEFMAFRTTVNFFYLILPTLGISPLQKFCFCHLLANGAERHFKVSWREIVGLAATISD